MSEFIRIMNDWFQCTPSIKKGLYAYQEKVIRALQEGENVWINKSRQTGLSTLMACYALMRALAGDVVVIASPSLKQSKNVMDYVRTFLLTLRSAGHDPAAYEETKTSILYVNGGALHSVPNSASTVRGLAAPGGLIVFDEFAHFLNGTDKEMMQAVIPMISRGNGQVVYMSTPFGEQGEYYRIGKEDEGVRKIVINYRECPDLNVERVRARLDEVTFAQEYDNQFIGEVDSYFPYTLLEPCINNDLEVYA